MPHYSLQLTAQKIPNQHNRKNTQLQLLPPKWRPMQQQSSASGRTCVCVCVCVLQGGALGHAPRGDCGHGGWRSACDISEGAGRRLCTTPAEFSIVLGYNQLSFSLSLYIYLFLFHVGVRLLIFDLEKLRGEEAGCSGAFVRIYQKLHFWYKK